MPRNFKLTWQPGKNGRSGRWRKKCNGNTHYFAGGSGKYDREAYEAAVAKWESLKAKTDQAALRQHDPDYERAILRWEEVLAWCNKHGELKLATTAFEKLEALRHKLAAPVPAPLPSMDTFESMLEIPAIPDLYNLLASAKTGIAISEFKPAVPLDFSSEANTRYAAEMDGTPMRIMREIWNDRLDVQKLEGAAPETSLEAYVKKYIAQKGDLSNAGEVSVGRIYALKLHLGYFQDWLGKTTPIKEIDGGVLANFHAQLISKVTSKAWSRKTANHYMTTVKSFVRWLWQTEAIDVLPRLLDGRSQLLKIGKAPINVIVFTKEEVVRHLANATGRTRLYILLMLNCGMTQKDIADLRHSEVDWDAGRIIRKRSKTADKENVPVVNYHLWPETLRLLRQERAAKSKDQVLLNSNGSPLWYEEIDAEGKYRKNDNVKSAFERLRRKLKINKPLKCLKKTSATLLRGNERFSALVGLFLGHAPQSMSDKHYTQVPQALLDQAIRWLGQEYGLIAIDNKSSATGYTE